MNAKQQKFVTEYLVDQNGTRAAQRAGYTGSDNTLAHRAKYLLRNDQISRAVQKGLAAQQKKIEARVEKKTEALAISKERIIERLAAIAFSDIGDAFQMDESGKVTMKIEDMKRTGFSKLIRKMRVLPGGKVEIDLHSVIPSIELLAKMNGWVKDMVEHSGEIAHPTSLTGEQYKNLLDDEESQKMLIHLAEKLSPPVGKPTKGEMS